MRDDKAKSRRSIQVKGDGSLIKDSFRKKRVVVLFDLNELFVYIEIVEWASFIRDFYLFYQKIFFFFFLTLL